MPIIGQEGYARLPEDLLRDLLSGTDEVVTAVTALLAPAIEHREALRTELASLGLIRRVDTAARAVQVAGVDGGFAVERTSAVDIALAVAVGVEGLSDDTTAWEAPQYLWWALPSRHDMDVERLARGVMVAQELAIISPAPHQVRILDGSHLTLVIQLNSALSSISDLVRAEARRKWEQLDTVDALAKACSDPSVIAMPKYDSSQTLSNLLANATGHDVPGDDKHLMGLILEPGELTVPQRVPMEPWASLHFSAPTKDAQDMATAFTEATVPLRQREIEFTYFKPDEGSPAFRIEIKAGTPPNALDEICATIAAQITGPFVQEPCPQYLADVMAKSVGLGLSAVQSAVQLSLSGQGKPEIAEYLIRSYRTEGV